MGRGLASKLEINIIEAIARINRVLVFMMMSLFYQ
jgi:hypothetical protein